MVSPPGWNRSTDPFVELISAAAIAARVAELGAQITAEYAPLAQSADVVVIGVLKGSVIFLADLVRHIALPIVVELIGISSYGDSTRSSGVVQITQDLSRPIEGKHVIVIEDIVDTGHTVHYLLENLATRRPASIKLCSLGTSYWLTPDLVQAGGVRDHYVRIHGRTVARITLGSAAGSSGGTAAGVTATSTVTGLLRGGAIALVALLLIGLATPVRARRRRPIWLTRASHLALIALLGPGCTGGGLGTSTSAIAWQTTRKLYLHQGVSAGPSLVTDATAAVYEERRYEPFGEAIDAYREGSGVAAVDYRREALNGLNKPSDPDTDMSYHGARWLPSDTAQWLTPDPPVKAPDPKFQLELWALHPYQYVNQNPIAYWDPDGNQPDVIDRTNDVDPISHKTFSTDDVSRLRDFFVQNAANPRPAGGSSGNTDPTKRYSCIGTLNHGIEKLFDQDLWTGNGESEVDKTQSKMIKKGMTLGEAKVKYTWDNVAKDATAKTSEWDTVLKLSKGDQGWSVYVTSVAGGYHSVTVTLDNRDTDNPVIIFSDQNGGSEGWKAFDNKADFDDFMKDWQNNAGTAYSDPNRDPKPLPDPPIGTRYVRLRPE
jgi:hypoxanthine phosphoribosyltransferase